MVVVAVDDGASEPDGVGEELLAGLAVVVGSAFAGGAELPGLEGVQNFAAHLKDLSKHAS